MPLLTLRDHVHAAVVDDDLVFLDVAADRYVCRAGGAQAARLSAGRTHLRIDDAAFARDLQAAGLAQEAEASAEPRPALPPRAGRSGLPPHVPPATLKDIPPAARILADALVHYRGRSLVAIVAACRRPGGEPPRLTATLEAAVVRFHGWIPYAPVTAQCLFRSFLLLSWLRRQDLDAAWVFGVRTWPFHAHCWLQVEDVVLDDPAERTWAYTPILVV